MVENGSVAPQPQTSIETAEPNVPGAGAAADAGTGTGTGAGAAAGAGAGAGTESGPAGLPRKTFVAILGLVVVLFLVSRGPVWQKPWDIDALDSAIFWSYLPIPFLVALGLFAAKRFSFRFLFLESLAITLLKYALTFLFALGLWATAKPPAASANVVAPPPRPVDAKPPTPPTRIPAEQRGTVRGGVSDSAGKPIAGAFVYVASGLEAFVFERPTEPVHIENDGRGAQPSFLAVRAGQTLLGRSLDSHLHTLVAAGDRSGTTFNIPMMSSGVWSSIVIEEPAAISKLVCTVHPNSEAPAHIVVLDHPFFTTVLEDGSFTLASVPATSVKVAAWHETEGTASQSVEVPPAGTVEVTLHLTK